MPAAPTPNDPESTEHQINCPLCNSKITGNPEAYVSRVAVDWEGLRGYTGLSRFQFSARLGLNPRTYTRLVKGEPVRVDTVQKVKVALFQEFGLFLDNEEVMFPSREEE